LFSRTIAIALTIVVGGGTLNWGHVGGDDADCDIVVVPHDHTAHRFAANPSGSNPVSDHCYICHSLRLLHAALTTRQKSIAAPLQRTCRIDTAAVTGPDAFAGRASSRAPPSASL
jgi:hypothetical protein